MDYFSIVIKKVRECTEYSECDGKNTQHSLWDTDQHKKYQGDGVPHVKM